MLATISKRLTYANVMSSIAVFLVVSGGVALAAINLPKNSVGSRELKRNSVTAPKIKRNSINTSKVRNRSLRAVDFKAGELPAGARGPQGPQGPVGVVGSVTYVSEDAFVNCNEDPETNECLPGPAGYERVAAVARCPDGMSPLGGGFHLLGLTGFDTPGAVIGEVVSSEPFADGGAAAPNSWRVLYDTNSLTFEQVRAWAACAPVSQ